MNRNNRKSGLYTIVATEAVDAVNAFQVAVGTFVNSLTEKHGTSVGYDELLNFCNEYLSESIESIACNEDGIITLKAAGLDLSAALQLDKDEATYAITDATLTEATYGSDSGEVVATEADEMYQLIDESAAPADFTATVAKFIEDAAAALGDSFEMSELARFCQNYDESGCVQINEGKIHMYSLVGQQVAYIPIEDIDGNFAKLGSDIQYLENQAAENEEDYEAMQVEATVETPATEMYKLVGNEGFDVAPGGTAGQAAAIKTNMEPAANLSKPKEPIATPVPLYSVIEPAAVLSKATPKNLAPSLERYQSIANMPNNKFAGNFAIEHMPVAFKHIWSGLTNAAKQVIAARSVTVATESDCLKFWSSQDFIAVERAILTADAQAIVALERETLPKATNPKLLFLQGKLPVK